MPDLQRITTEYIAAEDRIRLAGEMNREEASTSVVLWLTQRILNRLVPCLCEWLASGDKEAPIAELQQEFAQQKAQAELEPQAPVQVATQTQGNLVHSIGHKGTGNLFTFPQLGWWRPKGRWQKTQCGNWPEGVA